jgi:hypothetical protein
MTLLDRYIAKQYLINVVALTVILFSFVVVIDASLNIDEFLQRATALAKQQGQDDKRDEDDPAQSQALNAPPLPFAWCQIPHNMVPFCSVGSVFRAELVFRGAANLQSP